MLIKNTTVLAVFFMLSSSFIYSMEDPNHWALKPMNQPPSLKEQIHKQLADKIYQSYDKKLFKPKINGLMAGILTNLPTDAKEQLELPIYANLTYNYANRKPFSNSHKENLIRQIKEEKSLPKKIAKLFSDNLKAQESYLDTIKFWLNPTGFKQGFINSTIGDDLETGVFNCIFILSPFMWVRELTNMYDMHLYFITMWEEILKRMEDLDQNDEDVITNIAIPKSNLIRLYNQLTIDTTRLNNNYTNYLKPIFICGGLILLCNLYFNLKNNKPTNEYQPRQVKRFRLHYFIGSILGAVSITSLSYKIGLSLFAKNS